MRGYYMSKRRMLFGLFIMLTAFTVINVMILRYYSKENADSNKSDLTTNSSNIITSTPISEATDKKENEQLVSFQEFKKVYEYLSEEIQLKGYERKYSTDHGLITVVEPILAFNTRDRLILPNTGQPPEPTFEYMILENKESTCQIKISVCFNENYIGNNLHSYLFVNSDLGKIDHELDKKAVGAVTSFRNLLFHIQVSGINNEEDVLEEVLAELSNKVSGYF